MYIRYGNCFCVFLLCWQISTCVKSWTMYRLLAMSLQTAISFFEDYASAVISTWHLAKFNVGSHWVERRILKICLIYVQLFIQL